MIKILKLLFKSFNLIESKYKLTILLIIFLGIVISFLEILSIGIVFPIVELLVYDNLEESKFYNIIKYIYIFEDKKSFFKFIVIAIAIIFIVKNILLFFSKYTKDVFLFNLRNNLEVDFFKEYINKDLLFHKNTNSAKLITNLNTEVSIFIKSILLGSIEFLSSLIIIIFSLLMVFFVNYYISIYIVGLIAFLYFFVIFVFKKKVKILAEQRSKYTTARTKLIQESFNSINDIKNNFLEKILSDYLKRILFKISNTKLYIYFISLLPQFISEILIITSLFMGFIYALHNNLDLKIYLAEITLIIFSFFRIAPVANKLINQLNSILFALPTIDIISNGIKSLNKKKYNEGQYIKKINFNNSIRFSSVAFGYENKSLIFDNLNLEIKKNSIVGINGASGAGKTTLLNLLLGFYKPIAGKILVDDQNINKLNNYKDWLVNIGYVPQVSFIFDDTLRNNITLDFENSNPNETLMKSVLKKSELNYFVKKLKKKLNTTLGELGSKISGGQKQRIALARVLYQNREIIILDEATNSLDKIAEQKILKNLKKLNKTIIIVSHDIKLMNYCDNVYEIKNKKIFKIL